MKISKTLTIKDVFKHNKKNLVLFLLVLLLGSNAVFTMVKNGGVLNNKKDVYTDYIPQEELQSESISDPITNTTTETIEAPKGAGVTVLNRNNNTIIIKNSASSTGTSTSSSGKATSTSSSSTSTTQQVKVPSGMTLQSYLDHIALSQAMISTGGDPTKQAQVVVNATGNPSATSYATYQNKEAMTLCEEIARYMVKDLGNTTNGAGCLAMVKSEMLYTLNGVHSQDQTTKYNYFIKKIQELGY